MYAVVLFLYTVWENRGVFHLHSTFLSFKQPIKKIRINTKNPQSPRHRRLREAKRAVRTRMSWDLFFHAVNYIAGELEPITSRFASPRFLPDTTPCPTIGRSIYDTTAWNRE